MDQIKIDFDVDSRLFDLEERMNWWESLRPSFLERGYDLYHQVREFRGIPQDDIISMSPLSVSGVPAEHPYSFIGGDPPDSYTPVLNHFLIGRVICAQDRQHRQVAIKLMKINSEEYRILRVLSKEPQLFSAESFGCVVPPLDFLETDEHCFVVMPRWGDSATWPWFSTIREALCYMRCLLKGLCFLHERLIAHRDIKLSNVLMNHTGRFEDVYENPLRTQLRHEGRALYALFDFDCAVMFPRTSRPAERRLPGHESFIGGGNFSYDTAQGELDYDPFAYDVAALGQFFCENFQQLTPITHFLAPFLDRMMTRDIAKRYAATQALLAFDDFCSHLLPWQLDTPPPPAKDQCDPEKYDRWAGLSEDFVQQWSSHREPKLPLTTKVLRRICMQPLGYAMVQRVRRICAVFAARPSFKAYGRSV
ncbi:hypothetical protein BOTBODRAFT_353868 [Botryobasidium botryosum FD-172 SS1]|uniref:Protein kinase domain-containing protein n=1 Tax=Botryobasidium botryosum (strain FD-172 SS1) TaxID=930990 RepID=A0A067MHM5_BOTB1|nr:hypothetical protein BOTBODRAFT_353868 [Botryobasidium botryosum FD-172 SS1]